MGVASRGEVKLIVERCAADASNVYKAGVMGDTSAEANGDELGIWPDLFVVASNVVAFWSVRWAYKKSHILEAYVLLQSALASIVYHIVDITGLPRASVGWSRGLKHFDFYAAVLVLITLSAFTMVLHKHRAVPVVALGSGMVMGLQVRSFDTEFKIGVSAVCVFMVVISYIVRKRMPKCRPREVALSLAFVAAALFCFHSSIGPYWLMHSLWHIFIYMSTFFVLNIPVLAEIRRVLSWDTITDAVRNRRGRDEELAVV